MASRDLKVTLIGSDQTSGAFRSAKDGASGLSGHMGRMGDAIGQAAKVGVFALGGLGVAGAAAGLKTAASMEQARISFTTMLGSAEKADGFLRELAAFAAKTPFEFPELQTAASSLISAGFEAEKVIPIMTTLGDVTSGMGTGAEGVQRATVALQQMSAAGRITGEDLNQLRDAGVPVFDLLAAATGKSKEEIAKLASAGKLGKTEMQALFDALGSGKGLERFNGLMEKQSQSLSGVFSTLKDTVNMTLSNLVAPAIPAIKSALSAVPGLVTGAVSGVSSAFTAIKPAFDFAARTAKDAFESVRFDLSTARDDIVEQVGDWSTPVIKAFRKGIETGDFTDVGTAVGDALSAALRGAGEVARKITTGLSELLGKINWPQLAIEMGKQAPAVVLGFALGLLNFDLGAVLRTLADNWFLVLAGIVTLAFAPARVLAKIGEVLAKIPFAGSLLKWGFDALTAFSQGLVTKVGEALSAMGRAFIEGFMRVFPGIGTGFLTQLRALPTYVGVVASEIFDRARLLMTGLASAIGRGGLAVVRAAGDFTGQLVKVFREIIEDLADVGVAMMRGLGRGIANAAGGVLSAVRDIVSSIPSAVRKLLGINSPSRVFADIGHNMMTGLTKGIIATAGSPQAAMTEAISNLTPRAGVTATVQSAMAMPPGALARNGVDVLLARVADSQERLERAYLRSEDRMLVLARTGAT